MAGSFEMRFTMGTDTPLVVASVSRAHGPRILRDATASRNGIFPLQSSGMQDDEDRSIGTKPECVRKGCRGFTDIRILHPRNDSEAG